MSKMLKVLEEDLIVWIDCEMTGLDLNKDHIVEIACIVTDKDLKILDEAPDIVINYPEEVITSMNEWSWEHHTQSGLVDSIRKSKVSPEEADTIISEFIGKHFPNKGSAILAGNSVHVDKKFLEKDFPKTYEYFHYRIIDVSTIKELTRRWYPDVFANLPTFQNLHRALDDIKGSINELNYYRDMIFKHKLNPLIGEFVPSEKKTTESTTDSKTDSNVKSTTETTNTNGTTTTTTNNNTPHTKPNSHIPGKPYHKGYYHKKNNNYNGGFSNPNYTTYRKNNTTYFVPTNNINKNNSNSGDSNVPANTDTNGNTNNSNNTNINNNGNTNGNVSNYNKNKNNYHKYNNNNHYNGGNKYYYNNRPVNPNNSYNKGGYHPRNMNGNHPNNNNNNGTPDAAPANTKDNTDYYNPKKFYNKYANAKPFVPKSQSATTTTATTNTTTTTTTTTTEASSEPKANTSTTTTTTTTNATTPATN